MLGLTRLSQVRGIFRGLAEGVVYYVEANRRKITKKLAKAAWKSGFARLKSGKRVSPMCLTFSHFSVKRQRDTGSLSVEAGR